MFKSTAKKMLVLTLSASVVLTGCSSVGGGSDGADPRLNAGREAKFFSESGISACVTGGLIGGIGGALAGAAKGGKEAALYGLGGAAVGCLGTAGVNYYLEQQRTKYANKEDRLNAEIQQVKEANKELKTLTANARTVLNENNKMLADLQQQLKNKTIQEAQAKDKLALVDRNLKKLNSDLAKAKANKDNFIASAKDLKSKGANVKNYDAEIKKFEDEISELKGLIAQTTKQRTAIKLG